MSNPLASDADDGFAACSGTIPFGGPVLT